MGAWDFVDLWLVASAVWMFHSYGVFNHLAEGIKDQWRLSSETGVCVDEFLPSLSMAIFILTYIHTHTHSGIYGFTRTYFRDAFFDCSFFVGCKDVAAFDGVSHFVRAVVYLYEESA
jgi:hypothetical protein